VTIRSSVRYALLGIALAVAAAGVAAALVFSGDSEAATTKQYLARVAAVCSRYGPRLDEIRPPDASEPANVIDALERVAPLLKAQARDVRSLTPPRTLRDPVRRWLELQERRLAILDLALTEARRQDLLAMSVAYVDFMLSGAEPARIGRTIGIPQPPC
jgi:hypothetical protein